MTVTDKLYTLDEFLALPDTGMRQELMEGRLIEMSPTNGEHAIIGAAFAEELRAFVRPRRLGYVFGDSAAFTIDAVAGTYLAPDGAFVAKARLESRPKKQVPIAPDIAIEIMFDYDYGHPTEFKEKIRMYQAALVRLVWVVEPRKQQVQVYHPDRIRLISILGITDSISGESVLEGFTLPVRTLFEDD